MHESLSFLKAQSIAAPTRPRYCDPFTFHVPSIIYDLLDILQSLFPYGIEFLFDVCNSLMSSLSLSCLVSLSYQAPLSLGDSVYLDLAFGLV